MNLSEESLNRFYKTIVEIIAEREKVIITYDLSKQNSDGSYTVIEKNITVGN